MSAKEITLDAPLSAVANQVQSIPLGMRAGVDVVDLPPIPLESGIKVTANYVRWGPAYFSPRHRHTFDQVRYVASGRMKVGTAELGPGDILYVPEGAFYGPQKIVETETEKEAIHFNIQIPGPSRGVYLHADEQRAAATELSKVGVFKDGVFIRDGKTYDGFEAVHMHHTGAEPDYADPRVDGIVVFHTAAVKWQPVQGQRGVTAKHIAYLNDVGPNIKMLKLDPGATLQASKNTWEEFRFVIEGAVEYNGKHYASPAGFYCPDYLHLDSMSSSKGATMVVLQVARDAAKAPPFLSI